MGVCLSHLNRSFGYRGNVKACNISGTFASNTVMTTTCSNCLQEFELAGAQDAAHPTFCSKTCELAALAHSDSAQQWLARLDAEMEDFVAALKVLSTKRR